MASTSISVKVEDLGSTGALLIAAERRRQVDDEGFTNAHDDLWVNDELIEAAACYLIQCHHEAQDYDLLDAWPWDAKWYKPGGPIRDLVRAGALIAAEIDRRLRAAEINP